MTSNFPGNRCEGSRKTILKMLGTVTRISLGSQFHDMNFYNMPCLFKFARCVILINRNTDRGSNCYVGSFGKITKINPNFDFDDKLNSELFNPS